MKPLGSTSPNSETALQASRGKPLPYTDLRYTTAGFTRPALGEYGLRHLTPTRPALAPTDPVPVRRLIALLHASFRPHLAVTPLRFATLHLHQVGRGTSTLQVSRHARHALNDPRHSRGLIRVSASKAPKYGCRPRRPITVRASSDRNAHQPVPGSGCTLEPSPRPNPPSTRSSLVPKTPRP